ncbi:MAG TPA: zf-HC2 domain-containing protein [Streptosporangiaceae bacterium]
MSHLGQRLSALIDGELDSEDRDRVLVHLAKCEPCRAEAVALRTLKRRMNALGGETETDSALTGRLIELAGLAASLDARAGMGFASWSNASAARLGGRLGWPEARPAWYVLGGAVSVFLAGLGTAAFMAGGSPQAPEPEPHVTPAVDVFVLQHDLVGGAAPASPARPESPARPGLNRRTPIVP